METEIAFGIEPRLLTIVRFTEMTKRGEPFGWLGDTRVLIEGNRLASFDPTTYWLCEVVAASPALLTVVPTEPATDDDVLSGNALWREWPDGSEEPLGLEEAIGAMRDDWRGRLSGPPDDFLSAPAGIPPAVGGPIDYDLLAAKVEERLQLDSKIDGLNRNMLQLQAEVRVILSKSQPTGTKPDVGVQRLPPGVNATRRVPLPVLVDASQLFYFGRTRDVIDRLNDRHAKNREAKRLRAIGTLTQEERERLKVAVGEIEQLDSDISQLIQRSEWRPIKTFELATQELERLDYKPEFVLDHSTALQLKKMFGASWSQWSAKMESRFHIGAPIVPATGRQASVDSIVVPRAAQENWPIVAGTEGYTDFPEYKWYLEQPGSVIRARLIAGQIHFETAQWTTRSKNPRNPPQPYIAMEPLPRAADLIAMRNGAPQAPPRPDKETTAALSAPSNLPREVLEGLDAAYRSCTEAKKLVTLREFDQKARWLGIRWQDYPDFEALILKANFQLEGDPTGGRVVTRGENGAPGR